MQLSFVLPAVAVLAGALARAEQHTIRFENKCGKGTPQLIQGGKVLSTGQDFTSNGPFAAGIAYLQTGECGFNGENCALLEMTLVNPTSPGAGSSTDISLIAPHAFNVETSFSYFGGCDGQGATCDSGTCKSAFFQPNDNQVQVQCENNDVNLLITFCGDATQSTGLTTPDKGSSSAAQHSSSVAAAHSSPTATHTPAASHAATSAAASTHATSSVTVTSAASLVAQPSAASPSSAPSSASSCKAGSRRRRRSVPADADSTSSHKLRRHHARNADAAHGGASF
ncbi:hypothetical protein C8Q73DRAFT_693160 [Cubamyces lactineus]|nr:hypothetical protein C8Q73DRAFT_693160 [Cubamyces lactineus]